MTVSLRVELSHKYSWTNEVKAVFKLVLVPEKKALATGFHYILLIDASTSMQGQKMETAKAGAIELLSRIPEGNRATVIAFSHEVRVLGEYREPRALIPLVSDIVAEGALPFTQPSTMR